MGDLLIPIVLYLFSFIIIFSFISFIKNSKYDFFEFSYEEEFFHMIKGEVRIKRKDFYRRSKIYCIWQKKTKRLYVRKTFFGKVKIKQKNVWEDVVRDESKILEKQLGKKIP